VSLLAEFRTAVDSLLAGFSTTTTALTAEFRTSVTALTAEVLAFVEGAAELGMQDTGGIFLLGYGGYIPTRYHRRI
jgi:hypothetical protein